MKELFEIYDAVQKQKSQRKIQKSERLSSAVYRICRRSIALDALKIWLLLGFVVAW
mgnify:CR=1 FL=1